MKRTRLPNQPLSTATRLWTCSEDARQLLTTACKEGRPDAVDGILLQRAMIADSVTKAGEEGSRKRRFRISTETVDRHGDIVRSRGIQLKNYKKNPVVLFAHDSHMPPVGTGKVETGDGVVDAEADFFDRETYDFADTIFRIVDVGGLKATSIGFMPLKFERMPDEDESNPMPEWARGIDFQKVDLLEFSIVPIPANPDCVGRAFAAGAAMKSYSDWLEGIQDRWDSEGSLKAVLESLGIKQDNVHDAYKAANGGRIVVKGGLDFDSIVEELGDGTEKVEDKAPVVEEEQVPETETEEAAAPDTSTVGPAATEEDKAEDDEYGVVSVTSNNLHGVRLCEVTGELPPKARFAKALLTEPISELNLSVSEDGNEITLNFATVKAVYAKTGDEPMDILAELKSVTKRDAITYARSHDVESFRVLPKDSPWNAEKETELAFGTLPFTDVVRLFAWVQGDEEKPEGLKAEFLHHRVEGNGLHYKGVVSGIANLLGAKGGTSIPQEDRPIVFAHLAEHASKDFNIVPPAGEWIKHEPLKQWPTSFYFDYNECELLFMLSAPALGKFTVVNANFVGRGEDKFLVDPKSEGWTEQSVQAILGRKSAWKSQEEFLVWAKEQGFETSTLRETKTFWRLPQVDADGVQEVERTISIFPNDAEPGSHDCKVQAELVKAAVSEQIDKDAEDVTDSDGLYTLGGPRFLLPKAGGDVSILLGMDNTTLEVYDGPATKWAIVAIPKQGDGKPWCQRLRDCSAADAEQAAKALAGSAHCDSLILAKLAGEDDEDFVYDSFVGFRYDKDGSLFRMPLDPEAVDSLHELGSAIKRLQVKDKLSEQDRTALAQAHKDIGTLIGATVAPPAAKTEGELDLESDVFRSDLVALLGEAVKDGLSGVLNGELRRATGSVD